MDKIEEAFAEYLSNWEIRLPESAVVRRVPGALLEHGWYIRWVFGTDPGRGSYLDFHAVHRMTNDRHQRLYASGDSDYLPAQLGMCFHSPDATLEEREKNAQEFWQSEGLIAEAISRKFGVCSKTNENVEGVNPMIVTEYVAGVLQKHAPSMLMGDGVAVPGDEEEMNWRLFFAHSQDMQGFRADIFTGGPNEDDNARDPAFRGLRDRWPDSKTMISGLAQLWNDPRVRAEMILLTGRSANSDSGTTIVPMMDLLRGPAGNDATRVFADTLEDFSGPRIAYKTRKMVRAYVQNSALLAKHNASFLSYLRSIVPDLSLPSSDIVPAERVWREAIEHDFYNVGPALANYLIADWLLYLWREGQIGWFESYKSDSVFIKTLADSGKLPASAGSDFVGYCRAIQSTDVPRVSGWPTHFGFAVPPRLLNEAIWLEEAATSAVAAARTAELKSPTDVAFDQVNSVEDCDLPPTAASGASKETGDGDTRLFKDDDDGYLEWLRTHESGFVVNADRNPSPAYLVLHRARCRHVSRPNVDGQNWTAAYIKVCSDDRAALTLWARNEVGGELRPCGVCFKNEPLEDPGGQTDATIPGHTAVRVVVAPVFDSEEIANRNQHALNMDRFLAIQLGRETVHILDRGSYMTPDGNKVDIRGAVEAAVRAKVSITPSEPLPTANGKILAPFCEVRISVCNETTLSAAERLTRQGNGRVLALNFAAATHPGGGFLSGARAQEENLSRSSALHATLTGDPMYDFHRRVPGLNLEATDWAILSPGVPVFRTDDGTLLPEPWPCAFSTCAAPQANKLPPSVDASDLMRTRIERVLSIARAYGYHSLVLGAWGCGAFGCDPVAVSGHFRDALLGPEFCGCFSEVVFAITSWSPNHGLLHSFADAFPPGEIVCEQAWRNAASGIEDKQQ